MSAVRREGGGRGWTLEVLNLWGEGCSPTSTIGVAGGRCDRRYCTSGTARSETSDAFMFHLQQPRSARRVKMNT